MFYYLAEKRVDFRELVKDLARDFRTRIEMRQIGVRDEAKLLADYGDCGKPVCCNTHLAAMPPVSMKMAKLQKTTLDPSKISGRCGRLKCCLRYEFDTYRELERQLPAVGSQVVTSKGRGRVVGQEILAQKLVIEYEDSRRIIIGPDDVLSIEPSRNRQPPAEERSDVKSGRLGLIDPTTGQSGELMPSLLRGPMKTRATRSSPTDRQETATLLGPTGGIAGEAEVDERMNLRDQLARVIARDSRDSIESYAFVLESLKRARTTSCKIYGNSETRIAARDHANALRLRLRLRRPGKPRPSSRGMSPAANSVRPHGGWPCVLWADGDHSAG